MRRNYIEDEGSVKGAKAFAESMKGVLYAIVETEVVEHFKAGGLHEVV